MGGGIVKKAATPALQATRHQEFPDANTEFRRSSPRSVTQFRRRLINGHEYRRQTRSYRRLAYEAGGRQLHAGRTDRGAVI